MRREKEDTKEHNVMMQVIFMIIDCRFYPTTIHTLDIHIRRQLLSSIIMLYNQSYIPNTIHREGKEYIL